ncbi:MAG: polyphenol oxidase family protein [Bdellovibrionales bacterium]|nr:polyphenol oxidase family protein [Bdellovibrionales bacterium]
MNHVRFGFEVETKGQTRSLVTQIHGDDLYEVDSTQKYNALLEAPPPGDGVYTRLAHTPVYVFTADCVPILLYTENPKGPVVAVHCGWRGAAAGIAAKALTLFQAEDGPVHLVIGPCIHGDQYEVKEDFVASFETSDPNIREHLVLKEGKMFFDVSRYVLDTQLNSIPASRRHLEHATCTFSSGLPSYRRNGNTQTRLRSWIEKIA